MLELQANAFHDLKMCISSSADISESRELKHLSKHFAEMNDSLSQRLQSKEDLLTSTKNDLETTQKNLEQLVRGMNTLNASLLQCTGDRDTLQVQKEKAIQDHQTLERSFNETKLRVTQMEQGISYKTPSENKEGTLTTWAYNSIVCEAKFLNLFWQQLLKECQI